MRSLLADLPPGVQPKASRRRNILATYSHLDAASVGSELQQAEIALDSPPACENGIILFPSLTPA